MFSKCANPRCSTAFEYHLGGRFYRFHQRESAPARERNTHSVVHFWLCPRCAEAFSLNYDGFQSVLIRLPRCESPEEEFLQASHTC
jgi:hypothetical protein